MAYTLGEAARATGKSKPAISKAIKSGRLSASRADDGSYRIDPAELERVYPVTGSLNGQGRRDETPVDTSELTLWRTLATEREATIRDLRARLDASENDRRQIEAERRQLSERLTAVLTPPDRKQEGTLPLPPDDLKPSRLVTVSDPPAAVLQDGADPQKAARPLLSDRVMQMHQRYPPHYWFD